MKNLARAFMGPVPLAWLFPILDADSPHIMRMPVLATAT